LKINIGHIPEEGLNLHFDKHGDWFLNALPETEKSELSLSRVDVDWSVRKLKETIMIEGSFETALTANCSRCLAVTTLPIKNHFRYMLVPKDTHKKEDQELSSEDLEFGFFESDLVDLDTILYEQIMLQIPIKILCRDACKGLCCHCGTDLNTASCNCSNGFTDERLAVLKKFKKKEN